MQAISSSCNVQVHLLVLVENTCSSLSALVGLRLFNCLQQQAGPQCVCCVLALPGLACCEGAFVVRAVLL
jgi:hypothetical protein